MRPTPALALASAVLLASTPAAADTAIDLIEHIFGASNVNAVTGQGRMAAGISRDGDVTVLSWPNPSFSDQLGYIASNALDVRAEARFGAPEGAGLFFGLVTEDGAAVRTLSWLRDRDAWQIAQSYGPDDGANVHTTFTSDALGLTVELTDGVGVVADGDTLVRSLRIERARSSPVVAAWLVTYANLSPMPPSSHVAELPLADWGLDGRNDFAALWDEDAGAVVHFHPSDRKIYDSAAALLSVPDTDYGPIGELLTAGNVTGAEVADLAGSLDRDYQPGAYLALSTEPPPDQHQIGYDETPFCAQIDALLDNVLALPDVFDGFSLPLDPALVDSLRCGDDPPIPEQEGWQHAAEDALADAADGELSGSSIAGGEVNAALRTPLAFDARGVAEVTVALGAGADAATARAALLDAASIPASAEDALASWLEGRRLPEQQSEAVRKIARRALVNVRVGTDAATGAIVASIARQAPYGLDWPRDGAFFNVALDVSGQSALVDQRVALYGTWQRATPVAANPLIDSAPPIDPDTGAADAYPADAWEMNYYPDGMPGGNIRFEIDNTGFVLWSTVAHVGWVGDPRAYLEARWDTIARAANLLARWRDPATGLPAPAQEDDNAAYTQTLHGAVTTFGALDAAARAARLLGRDADAERWEARARELRDAILTLMYDPTAGRFVSEAGTTGNPGSSPSGPTAWLVWPMRLLPWSDTRVQQQLAHDLALITPALALESDGGAYYLKNTVSIALAREGGEGLSDAEILDLLAAHPSDTQQFGEVMVVVDDDGTRRADQRVANPHLWEGTLFYLTAMAVEDPAALLRYDAVLPPSQLDASEEDDGCGCRLAGAPQPSRGWVALLLAAWLLRRRQC